MFMIPSLFQMSLWIYLWGGQARQDNQQSFSKIKLTEELRLRV